MTIYDFFISYPREHRDDALDIQSTLKSRGARIFVDECPHPEPPPSLSHGRFSADDAMELRAYFGRMLRSSKILLVLWGQGYQGSEYCQWEISEARDHGLEVWVVRVDHREVTHELIDGAFLTDRQCLELWPPDQDYPDGEWGRFTPLRAPPWALLYAPARWRQSIASMGPNYAAVERWAARMQPSDRSMWQTGVFALLACLLIYGLAWAAANLVEPQGQFWVRRHLLLSLSLSVFGGLVLFVGHGVGAASASSVYSSVVGAVATFAVFMLGHKGQFAPGAATAGALLGINAAYRQALTPIWGRTATTWTLPSANFVQAHRIEEGFAHGILSALVALSLYLMPVVGIGLDIEEGHRALWGLVGAMLLAVWTWFLIKGAGDDLIEMTRILVESGELSLELDEIPTAITRRTALKLGVEHLPSQISSMFAMFVGTVMASYAAASALFRESPGPTSDQR